MGPYDRRRVIKPEVAAVMPARFASRAKGGPERRDLFILDANGKVPVARMPVPGLAMYAHQ